MCMLHFYRFGPWLSHDISIHGVLRQMTDINLATFAHWWFSCGVTFIFLKPVAHELDEVYASVLEKIRRPIAEENFKSMLEKDNIHTDSLFIKTFNLICHISARLKSELMMNRFVTQYVVTRITEETMSK